MLSFRTKLTLWYSLVLVLVLFVFGYITYFSLSRTLLKQIDNSLWLIAETEIASMIDSPDGEIHIHEVAAVSTQGLLDKYVQLVDLQGKIIHKSQNLGNGKLPVSPELINSSLQGHVSFESLTFSRGTSLRLISLPVTDKGVTKYLLQLGTSLDPVQQILDDFLLVLIPLGLVCLLIAGGGGWFLARQAMKPVARITETAQDISSLSLDKRLEFKVTPDEIGRLIQVLNEMLERLEQAFESQKRFVSDASHELRTPLTVLKGTIEVLLRRKRSTQEYEEGLGSSLEEIDRLGRLVNNLLVLARSDAGRAKLNFQTFRLDRLIMDVCGKMEVLAHQKEIAFHSNINEGIEFYGDSDRLKQLFINLLDNAIRFSPPKGRVSLSLEKEGCDIKIIVSDTGVGISESDLPHIFERFYRADQARRREESGGSGLGLSIAQWIAQAHQGEILLESQPGKGSVFTVLFHQT